MAGAGVSGQYGDVKIGATQVCEVCKWSFTPKANNPSYASNKTGGYKARVAGIKDGSGSIEGKYDPANPIMATLDVGTLVTLKLYLTATVFYSVPSIIDSLKIDVDLDTGDFVSFTADFSTNGAWTNPVAGLVAAPPPEGGDGPLPMSAPEPLGVPAPGELSPAAVETVARIVAQTMALEREAIVRDTARLAAEIAVQAIRGAQTGQTPAEPDTTRQAA